jgi:hypothetical protein
MARSIDYGNLMHQAMRGLIRKVLTDVSENGLPGQHHFFITFDTMHPDVEMADWLSDRYPGEMTIVLQHWFDNLDVTEDGFAVTLNMTATRTETDSFGPSRCPPTSTGARRRSARSRTSRSAGKSSPSPSCARSA